ncbi:hypothetical protein BDN72DRAFT_866025 [Pluteus cervinus]|uniref:Uncharacterized protein n=1 Tax=Pluteus cervinus TaxID=181527 RepID=A0ACD2ZY22_9AGAR|nr:hypothetical protein BDN72DRAFT_866025 [Pluteus cervinus]
MTAVGRWRFPTIRETQMLTNDGRARVVVDDVGTTLFGTNTTTTANAGCQTFNARHHYHQQRLLVLEDLNDISKGDGDPARASTPLIATTTLRKTWGRSQGGVSPPPPPPLTRGVGSSGSDTGPSTSTTNLKGEYETTMNTTTTTGVVRSLSKPTTTSKSKGTTMRTLLPINGHRHHSSSFVTS